MKKLYNQLIPNGDNYKNYLTTRQKEKMFIRHLVRYVYKKNGMTLEQVAKAEGRLSGKVPHHSTIINSIEEIEKIL